MEKRIERVEKRIERVEYENWKKDVKNQPPTL